MTDLIIKPYGDRILLEPQEKSKESKAGIVLAETAEQEIINIGKILALGPACQDSSLKEGQKVIFDKYSPIEVVINKKKYFFVKSKDISAIIE